MTLESTLKDLIVEKHGSMVNFAKEIGMANSTLATIMRGGINKASITNVIKICHALGISADGLAHGIIVPVEDKPVKDLDQILSMQRIGAKSQGITMDGEPLTDDEIETLFDGLDMSIKIIKRQRNQRKRMLAYLSKWSEIQGE